MKDFIRAFIAMNLPESVLQLVQQIQLRLKSMGIRMTWVAPQNVHLTLKFLGDIEPADIEKIAAAISESAVQLSPLLFSARGIGVFPDLRMPRVLWLGLTGDIFRLMAFQKNLEDRLFDISQGLWKREERHFKAHLTVGRIKARIDPALLIQAIRELEQVQSDAFTVDTFHLMQSRLTPSGSIYTTLKQICLDVPKNCS